MNPDLRKTIERMWVVEAHPKGAIEVRQMMEVLERNMRLALSGEPFESWIVVGLFPDVSSASQGRAEVIRRRKAQGGHNVSTGE